MLVDWSGLYRNGHVLTGGFAWSGIATIVVSVSVNLPVCGELTVEPLVVGSLSVAPLVEGDLSVEPFVLGGLTIEPPCD